MLVVAIPPTRDGSYRVIGYCQDMRLEGRFVRFQKRPSMIPLWEKEPDMRWAPAENTVTFEVVEVTTEDEYDGKLHRAKAIKVDTRTQDPTVLPGFTWDERYEDYRLEEGEDGKTRRLKGNMAIVMDAVIERLGEIEMQAFDAYSNRRTRMRMNLGNSSEQRDIMNAYGDVSAEEARHALRDLGERVNRLRRYLAQVTDTESAVMLARELLAEKESEIEAHHRRRADGAIREAQEKADKKLKDEIDRRFGTWQQVGRRQICL